MIRNPKRRSFFAFFPPGWGGTSHASSGLEQRSWSSKRSFSLWKDGYGAGGPQTSQVLSLKLHSYGTSEAPNRKTMITCRNRSSAATCKRFMKPPRHQAARSPSSSKSISRHEPTPTTIHTSSVLIQRVWKMILERPCFPHGWLVNQRKNLQNLIFPFQKSPNETTLTTFQRHLCPAPVAMAHEAYRQPSPPFQRRTSSPTKPRTCRTSRGPGGALSSLGASVWGGTPQRSFARSSFSACGHTKPSGFLVLSQPLRTEGPYLVVGTANIPVGEPDFS